VKRGRLYDDQRATSFHLFLSAHSVNAELIASVAVEAANHRQLVFR
jgi:hypothetical protein